MIWTFPIVICYYIGLFCSEVPCVCLIGLLIAFCIHGEKIPFIGDGDLDVAVLMFSAMPSYIYLRFMLLACVFGVLYYLVKRESTIPFVTCMSMSYAVWYTNQLGY